MESVESDMKLLLGSLQCSNFDAEQQVEALKALATMCSNDDKQGECFSKLGGLKVIGNMFCSVSSPIIKQWSLFVLSCAAQDSVSNKQQLCSMKMIESVNQFFRHKKPNILSVFCANFLLSICSNYAKAQDIARDCGCIGKLIAIFKETVPKSDEWFDSPDKVSRNLWTTVSSTLCSMMSEPQNDANKVLCADALPQAISVLKIANKDILSSSLNLICHVISSNGKTQRMLKIIGGFNSLLTLLKRRIATNDGHEDLTALTLQTISCGLTNYDINKAFIGSLGIIPLLIEMIKDGNLSDVVETSCLVCLSRCIDDCDANVLALHRCNGVQTLVSTIISSENEERRKIAILILQHCKISPKDKGEVEVPKILSKDLNLNNQSLMQKNGTLSDVFQRRANDDYVLSKEDGTGSLTLTRDMNLNIKSNTEKNDKDNAILSLLANQSEMLFNVTKQVNEMKERFHANSDAASTASTRHSSATQPFKRGSVISARTGLSSKGSHLQYSRADLEKASHGQRMVLLARGALGPNATRVCKTTSRISSSSSLRSLNTAAENSSRRPSRRVDLSKRAIMNAHQISKRSNLFVAGKMGQKENRSICNEVGSKLNKRRLNYESCTVTQRSEMEEKIMAANQQRKAVEKGENNDQGQVDSGRKSIAGNERSLVSVNKFKEGLNAKRFYKKDQSNGVIKRRSKRETCGVRKQRNKDLPTVIGGVPMLEQSGHEKVQGWIDNSLPIADNAAYELNNEGTESCSTKKWVGSSIDMEDDSKWENISSVIAAESDDEESIRQTTEIENKDQPVSNSLRSRKDQGIVGNSEKICTNDDEDDVAGSVADVKRTPPTKDIVSRGDEMKTPSSVLPTRLSNRRHKLKRSCQFNKDDAVMKNWEKSCSSVEMSSDDNVDVMSEVYPVTESSIKTNEEFQPCRSSSKRGNVSMKDSNGGNKHDPRNCPAEEKAAYKNETYSHDHDGKDTAKRSKYGVRRMNESRLLSVQDVPAINSSNGSDNVVSISSQGEPDLDNGKELVPGRVKTSGYSSCMTSKSRSIKRHRKRKDYDDFEVENIYKGVKRFGRRWTAIINTYPFKSGRTAEDLKDKFKRLCKQNDKTDTSVKTRGTIESTPFTTEEIVNLKTGHGRYGARWKTILNSFKFQRGRTAKDLEKRFANLVKKIN